jgi:AcrR family transcriptional regulator
VGQPCRTCQHPRVREIKPLKESGTTLQELSDAFGLSKSTLTRHLHSKLCAARMEALECAPDAVQVLAGGMAAPRRLSPVLRRRAIAPSPRSVKPVSLGEEDRGDTAGSPIAPVRLHYTPPIPDQLKSPLPTTPKELALLQAIGYNEEGIADLLGGGAKVVHDVTSQEWAGQLVRLRVDYLFNLRRQQQLAMDNYRHREARQFNADIDRAMEGLFKILERFGYVGPIDASERSRGGRGAEGIRQMVLDMYQGKPPLELTEEEEVRFQEEERRALA